MTDEQRSAQPEPAEAEASSAAELAEQALHHAQKAVEGLARSEEAAAKVRPLDLPAFDAAGSAAVPRGIDLLSDVNLNVKIELGRTRMLVEDVLRLSEGAVVELDKLAGDPVDVYVNDRHIARGEVLILNDTFCVRINEILQNPGVAGDADGQASAA